MNKTIQQLALGSIFALACTLNMNAQVVSQKVGTNPTIITPSTAFEVESANKGVLLPRVALTSATDATTILAPTTSMLVYNTATAGTSPNNVTPGYYYWTGTAWTRINNGTPSADKTDDEWVNNPASTRVELGKKADGTTARDAGTEFVVNDNGRVGIGTTDPWRKLQIAQNVGSNEGLSITTSDYVHGTTGTALIFRSSAISGNTDYELRVNQSGGVTSGGNLLINPSGGNVGINTTTPTTKLHIDNGTTAGAIRIVDGTQGAGKVLTSDANGVGTWQAASAAAAWALTGNAGTVASTNFIGTTDAIDFVTRTNNTERMRVTSTGNVGIGTTTPRGKLEVSGSVYSSNGDYKILKSGVTSGSNIGMFDARSQSSTGELLDHPQASIVMVSKETPTSFGSGTSAAGAISFRTSPGGGTSEMERMLINENGNVGIGTATPTYKTSIHSSNDNVFEVRGVGSGWGGTKLVSIYSENTFGSGGNLLKVGSAFNQNIINVLDDGKVGIGTASPIAKLHVENGGLRVQTSGAATSGVFNGNLSNLQIFHPSGTDANIRLFNSSGSLILGVNETGVMVGNVGIGTATPSTKLHIDNGTTAGAIRIVDGTQGDGKVLMSDANGVGTWKTLPFKVVYGTTPTSLTNVSTVNGGKYINSSILIPDPGTYTINVGLLGNSSTGALEADKQYALRLTLSSSTSSVATSNFSYVGSSIILGVYFTNTNPIGAYFGFISGSITVTTTAPNTTLYLWEVNSISYSNITTTLPAVGSNGENYFYATKLPN